MAKNLYMYSRKMVPKQKAEKRCPKNSDNTMTQDICGYFYLVVDGSAITCAAALPKTA